MDATRYGIQHCATEWAYSSGRAYPDPFNDVELDLVIAEPGEREPTLSGASRWHSLLLAWRHLVDGPVQAATLAGRLPRLAGGPGCQGVQCDPDCRRPLSGYAGVRRAWRERGELPLGSRVSSNQPRLLRRGRPANPGSRPGGTGAVYRRLLGLLCPLDGNGAAEAALECVTRAVATEPPLPVVNGEVCYEGILADSREEIQRLMFWSCLLSGAAGHTYGANGI